MLNKIINGFFKKGNAEKPNLVKKYFFIVHYNIGYTVKFREAQYFFLKDSIS